MAKAFICTSCGCYCYPQKKTRGSFAIEIILWLFFLIPGLIYTIWRLTTRYSVCPKCGHSTLVPSDSPVGQKLLNQYHIAQTENGNSSLKNGSNNPNVKRQITSKKQIVKFIRWGVIFALLFIGLGAIFDNLFIGILLWLSATVLLPQSAAFLRKKLNFNLSIKIQVIIAAVLLIFVAMSLIFKIYPIVQHNTLVKLSEKPNSVAESPGGQSSVNKPAASESNQQQLEDALRGIVPQFYGMSYRNLDIENADPDRPVGTKMITVGINNTEFLDRSQLLGTSGDLSSKIFQEVFSSNLKAYDVFVSYYSNTTDRYGNQKEEAVVIYGIDKNTYDKIDWTSFAKNNLCNFLQQESNVEGGTGNDNCSILAGVQ